MSLLLTFSAWPADSEDLTLSDQLLSNLKKPLHLWSLQQVKRLASSYEFIPLDRFLLWFHPDGRTVTLDQFDGLANSVYKLLRDGKMEGDLPGEGRDHHDKFAITLAAALKLIRYGYQFHLSVPNPQDWVKEEASITHFEIYGDDPAQLAEFLSGRAGSPL